LTSDLSKVQSQISNYETQVSENNSQIENLTNSLNTEGEEKSKIEGSLKEMLKEFQIFKTAHGKVKSEYEEKVTTMNTEIESLNSDKQLSEAFSDELRGQMKELESHLSLKDDSLAELVKKLEISEEKISQQNAGIAETMGIMSEITKKYEETVAERDDAKQKFETLQEANSANSSESTEMISKLSANLSDAQNLTKKFELNLKHKGSEIENLQKSISNLTKEKSEIQTSFETFQAQVQTLTLKAQADQTESNSKITKLGTELENMKTELSKTQLDNTKVGQL
jgi:chromosome segregation ATPase